MMRNRGNPETTTKSTTTKKKVYWSSNVEAISKPTTNKVQQDPITTCICGTFICCSCVMHCIEECVADCIELIVDLIICTDADKYYTDDDEDDSDIISDTSANESNQKVVAVSPARRMSTNTGVKDGEEFYQYGTVNKTMIDVNERALPHINTMVSTTSRNSSSNPHTVLIHINGQFQPCYYDASVMGNKTATAAAAAGVVVDTKSIASNTKNNGSSSKKKMLFQYRARDNNKENKR